MIFNSAGNITKLYMEFRYCFDLLHKPSVSKEKREFHCLSARNALKLYLNKSARFLFCWDCQEQIGCLEVFLCIVDHTAH